MKDFPEYTYDRSGLTEPVAYGGPIPNFLERTKQKKKYKSFLKLTAWIVVILMMAGLILYVCTSIFGY